MQAGQFSRTQGLRRKLKEPRSAGQSSAASLCSQCTTSDDDSNRVSFMSYVCHITHVHATKFKMKKRTNPRIPVLFCVSRQKLATFRRKNSRPRALVSMAAWAARCEGERVRA